MKSKDILLSVIKKEETGYIPCSIYFNDNLSIKGYDLRDPEDRIKAYMDLGSEPVIDIEMPLPRLHDEVSVKVWEESVKGEKYPILFKEYQTPEGVIRQGEKKTEDWPFKNDIPHPGNDHTASNIFEPLIKDDKDIKALKYLWQSPDNHEINRIYEKNRKLFELAEKYGVLTRATVGQGLATPMFFMGAQNLVYYSVDHEKAFEELAVIEKQVVFERIRIAKDYGVDLLKRFGGYEMTNFFTPEQFDRYVFPYLKETVAEAKKYEIPIYYRVVTGMKPLLGRIAEAGFDMLEGFEPELSDCRNIDIHDAFYMKACLFTGISSPLCLGHHDDTKVRAAVRECMDIFKDTPFILGVTNSIRNHWPFENTLAMMDEYRKILGEGKRK